MSQGLKPSRSQEGNLLQQTFEPDSYWHEVQATNSEPNRSTKTRSHTNCSNKKNRCRFNTIHSKKGIKIAEAKVPSLWFHPKEQNTPQYPVPEHSKNNLQALNLVATQGV